ncbi:MAG: DegT/DnrJ/EryC1/StrS family aminotransferase [Desulfovibrionaceae bacterium]
MNIRLSRSVVGTAEAAAVTKIITEEGYLGMGAEVQRFEAELAAYLGVQPAQVITVNTGTAALHLAVQAAVPTGSEVLVPSLTFVASFQAIAAAGCVPVPCDVYANTATIDLEDAARRITPRTKAIMPVHYASNPWHLDAVYAFAARHKLRVIEDAAHAFGCAHQGHKIGSRGDIVCFSFDGIKNITSGEGGCIVSFDSEVARLCSDARLLSVENDTEKRYTGGRSWDFDVHCQGYRYHMSNIMAAIGRVQLSRLDAEFAPARRHLLHVYRTELANVAGLRLLELDSADDIVPHIHPVRVLHGRKDEVKARLAEQNIPTGVHYKPNHLLTYFKEMLPQGAPLPVTEQLYAELVTLPLHPAVTEQEVRMICAALRKAVA